MIGNNEVMINSVILFIYLFTYLFIYLFIYLQCDFKLEMLKSDLPVQVSPTIWK